MKKDELLQEFDIEYFALSGKTREHIKKWLSKNLGQYEPELDIDVEEAIKKISNILWEKEKIFMHEGEVVMARHIIQNFSKIIKAAGNV